MIEKKLKKLKKKNEKKVEKRLNQVENSWRKNQNQLKKYEKMIFQVEKKLMKNFNSEMRFLEFRQKKRNTPFAFFSCPGSSIPDLGHSLSGYHFRILTQRVTFEI